MSLWYVRNDIDPTETRQYLWTDRDALLKECSRYKSQVERVTPMTDQEPLDVTEYRWRDDESQPWRSFWICRGSRP